MEGGTSYMKRRGLEKFSNLVEALSSLPTVGKKSALRYAYHMVLEDSFSALKLAHAIEDAVLNIKTCQHCGALSEDEICDVCHDDRRDSDKLCIVQSAKDIFVIESNASYDGKYFVLDSIDTLLIENLEKMITYNRVKEVIFAFTPSLPNDTTILFVEDKLQKFDLVFTKIAQGVPTGVNLENVDMLSLSKALHGRTKI